MESLLRAGLSVLGVLSKVCRRAAEGLAGRARWDGFGAGLEGGVETGGWWSADVFREVSGARRMGAMLGLCLFSLQTGALAVSACESCGAGAVGVGASFGWFSGSFVKGGALYFAELQEVGAGCGEGLFEESLTSRPRRARRDKLFFGTYEAWCALPKSGAAGGGCAASHRVDAEFGRRAVWLALGSAEAAGFGRGFGDFPNLWQRDKSVPSRALGVERCSMRLAGVPLLTMSESFQKPAPTLGQVSSYFVEALGENPKGDGERRLRFERWQGFAWGTSWRRCVLSGVRGGVCLEWWANDDFGLSELREFFEAPFFDVPEAQRFHSWFSEGGWHRGELRGCPMSMGVLSTGDYVYVRLRWWMPDD